MFIIQTKSGPSQPFTTEQIQAFLEKGKLRPESKIKDATDGSIVTVEDALNDQHIPDLSSDDPALVDREIGIETEVDTKRKPRSKQRAAKRRGKSKRRDQDNEAANTSASVLRWRSYASIPFIVVFLGNVVFRLCAPELGAALTIGSVSLIMSTVSAFGLYAAIKCIVLAIKAKMTGSIAMGGLLALLNALILFVNLVLATS